MKKGLFIFSFLFAMMLPMFGQTGDFDFPAPESHLGIFASKELRLAKKLHLNTEQRLRLDEINNAYVTKTAALKSNKSLDRAGRRLQRNKLNADRETQFVQLLHADQLTIWQESRQAKRHFRKHPR
ncbi:MAG: hypothetical protein RIS64_2621 [Bacteroidota bacterium]|jgi:hypothetical protein